MVRLARRLEAGTRKVGVSIWARIGDGVGRVAQLPAMERCGGLPARPNRRRRLVKSARPGFVGIR